MNAVELMVYYSTEFVKSLGEFLLSESMIVPVVLLLVIAALGLFMRMVNVWR